MASWSEMGVDALRAAKTLKDAGRHRSSVSRSYYAAFSVVTAKIASAIAPSDFGRYEHPPHREMTRFIGNHLAGPLSPFEVGWLKSLIRRLYKARLDADYVSGASIDVSLARDALRDAHAVFRLLEVPE